MASIYQQVGYGSSGESVKKLQNLLNQQGYVLDEDGVFGQKTQAAVKDYQKKNDLLLDGVAGDQTWSSLMDADTKKATPTVSSATVEALQALEKGLISSYETMAARVQRKKLEAAKPEAYQSDFDEQLKELYEQIAQREAFRYDPKEDPAYQSYAKQYQRQGKLAMEDTLGKAAGLTGGYGSSYAESAAQQAYGEYLAKLQDAVPALQENAWQQYKAQGEALMQRYDRLKEQDNTAYEQWRDEVNAWRKAVDAAQSEYEYSAAADLKKYQMMLDYYADKAAAEVKAAQSGAAYPAAAVSSIGNTAALSSTARDSLERTMTNYLKAGKNEAAVSLYTQYKSRLTPNQLKLFEKLLGTYGAAIL